MILPVKHILLLCTLLISFPLFPQSPHVYKAMATAHPWVVYIKADVKQSLEKDTLVMKNPKVIVNDSGVYYYPVFRMKSFGEFAFNREQILDGTTNVGNPAPEGNNEQVKGKWYLKGDQLKLAVTALAPENYLSITEYNYRIVRINDATLHLVRIK